MHIPWSRSITKESQDSQASPSMAQPAEFLSALGHFPDQSLVTEMGAKGWNYAMMISSSKQQQKDRYVRTVCIAGIIMYLCSFILFHYCTSVRIRSPVNAMGLMMDGWMARTSRIPHTKCHMIISDHKTHSLTYSTNNSRTIHK